MSAYSRLQNEGGEGYNHDQETRQEQEPAWSKMMDRKAKVERIMDGTNPDSPRYAELTLELAELSSAIAKELGK